MDLTSSQADILSTFRARVQDIIVPSYDHDFFLVKWLKARNFDLEKAEDMFRNHMKWRYENEIDKLVANYKSCELLKKHFPMGSIGFDKDGCTIILIRCGLADFKGLLSSVGPTKMTNYCIVFVDIMVKNSYEWCKKYNKDVSNAYVVLDMEGVSMKQILFRPMIEWSMEIINLYNAHFPETMKTGLIINCSKVFYTGYNMCKYILPEETKKKFKFFSNTGWQEVILQDIDASQVPEFYGGTLQDGSGDPKCPNLLNLGGQIPEENYRCNRLSNLVSEGRMKCLNIPRGSKGEVEVYVQEPNSILRWTVCIEANDIDFEVRQVDGIENRIHKQKLASFEGFDQSDYICSRPGKYVLRFDNGNSYFRSKQVYYSFEVAEKTT